MSSPCASDYRARELAQAVGRRGGEGYGPWLTFPSCRCSPPLEPSRVLEGEREINVQDVQCGAWAVVEERPKPSAENLRFIEKWLWDKHREQRIWRDVAHSGEYWVWWYESDGLDGIYGRSPLLQTARTDAALTMEGE